MTLAQALTESRADRRPRRRTPRSRPAAPRGRTIALQVEFPFSAEVFRLEAPQPPPVTRERAAQLFAKLHSQISEIAVPSL
jgi:hypothetical protein